MDAPEPRLDYAAFLDLKTQLGSFDGFEPVFMPDFLFDFQKALVDWAVRKGKAAIFAPHSLASKRCFNTEGYRSLLAQGTL